MSYVEAASDAIAPLLATGNTVILESTSPAGTIERLTTRLREARPDLVSPTYVESFESGDVNVRVAHCP